MIINNIVPRVDPTITNTKEKPVHTYGIKYINDISKVIRMNGKTAKKDLSFSL